MLHLIRSKIQFWLRWIARRVRPRTDATTIDRKEWARHSQEGEFRFHKTNAWRKTDDFSRHAQRHFEHFGLFRELYRGKTIIDLGAGSRLRSRYFEDVTLIAIEPLASRFLKEIPWCDLEAASEIYSVAAEERIDSCVNRADLLISINVLDHCYHFGSIVANIREYLKPSGSAFLSFDKHDIADEMHPLELTEEVCERVFAEQGLRIERYSTGLGDLLDGRQTYGHGPYCLNYWLIRADQEAQPRCGDADGES